MTNIREPAVAGMFYPADPVELRMMVQDFLADADKDGSSAQGNHLPPCRA